MIKKKPFLWIAGLLVVVIIGWVVKSKQSGVPSKEFVKIVHPEYGNIESTVSTTGTVQPQNRLELKPTVSGRVEKILVEEGTKVKKGKVLAWLSSAERAALVDAARAQGEAAVKYWEDAYKLTPLVAPIDGEVIVKAVEPGQAVSVTEPVIVLSDRLIVKAQFDETDIGKVKVGQSAEITLDAYPDSNVQARVDHISYESQTVNNVTIYNVDIVPEKVPAMFRSGMSANVTVIEKRRKNVLLLPIAAVHQDNEGNSFVVLVTEKDMKGNKKPDPAADKRKVVETGIADDTNIEIISGVEKTDNVIIQTQSYQPAKETSAGRNPFMPSRRPGQGRNR